MSKYEVMYHKISLEIKRLRKEAKLSQEELAEKADLTPQFVSYAESGKRAMRPENLLKLSKNIILLKKEIE